MANVITLPDGGNETIFDERDFLYLVEERMGFEARRWLEGWLSGDDDLRLYIKNLESDLKEERERRKDVMAELRKEAETIAGLICEKEIDRKALSAAAGSIGSITWREVNG